MTSHTTGSQYKFSWLLFAAALVAACKGETVTKDSPQTLENLAKCKTAFDEKQKTLAQYEADLAKLQRTATTTGEIVLSIEGSALTIKSNGGGGGGGPGPIDDKAALAASGKFIDLVSKSRGAIQKCYEAALKKDNRLQAQTVTLRVSASFNAAGAHQTSNFTPEISSTFDTCMRAISNKWQMPAGPQAMSFKASVTLTPS